MLTKLRKLRKYNEITLDEVAAETGLSIGYINRIERGYITEIKNPAKRKALISYIKKLEKKTKEQAPVI
ncbi:MAG: helix-turn-helix domain-containing protein [bacterium]|jgi:transcriptional regulator with XRE-family HTH domain|nr:helix-turn-helix domain-containing protein [bacterium]